MPRVRIEAARIQVLADELSGAPERMRRATRERLRRIGQRVATRGRSNSSWSRRIPGAIRVQTTLRAGQAGGFSVGVDGTRAPHGGLLEGGRRRTFRHPVFKRAGKRNPWVTQRTRPYLRPAWEAERAAALDDVARAAVEAIDLS